MFTDFYIVPGKDSSVLFSVDKGSSMLSCDILGKIGGKISSKKEVKKVNYVT